MSKFSSCSGCSINYVSIFNNSRANSRTDKNTNKVSTTFSSSKLLFANRRNFNIITNKNWNIKFIL